MRKEEFDAGDAIAYHARQFLRFTTAMQAALLLSCMPPAAAEPALSHTSTRTAITLLRHQYHAYFHIFRLRKIYDD